MLKGSNRVVFMIRVSCINSVIYPNQINGWYGIGSNSGIEVHDPIIPVEGEFKSSPCHGWNLMRFRKRFWSVKKHVCTFTNSRMRIAKLFKIVGSVHVVVSLLQTKTRMIVMCSIRLFGDFSFSQWKVEIKSVCCSFC